MLEEQSEGMAETPRAQPDAIWRQAEPVWASLGPKAASVSWGKKRRRSPGQAYRTWSAQGRAPHPTSRGDSADPTFGALLVTFKRSLQ